MTQLRDARLLIALVIPLLGMVGCACERWDREPNGVPPRTHPLPQRDTAEPEDVSEGEGRPALSPPPPAMPPHSPRGHERVEEHHSTEAGDRHPEDGM